MTMNNSYQIFPFDTDMYELVCNISEQTWSIVIHSFLKVVFDIAVVYPGQNLFQHITVSITVDDIYQA